jgi:hypothetical protein
MDDAPRVLISTSQSIGAKTFGFSVTVIRKAS